MTYHTVRQSVSQTDKHENGEPENSIHTHRDHNYNDNDIRRETGGSDDDVMVNSAVIHLFIMYSMPISTKFGADIEA